MRFDNDGVSLWFGTPDAPSPTDTVPAGAEITITIAVQPGDRSNKVEVLYRVNEGFEETVSATWSRNDAQANVQYFRARLPSRLAGDIVEYIPVCRRAGRMAPSNEDIKRARLSLRVTGVAVKASGKSPASGSAPPTDRLELGAPASRASPEIGEPGSGKWPFGANMESGGGVNPNLGHATGSHAVPTAGRTDPTAENPPIPPSYETRINTLTAVLSTNKHKQAVKAEFLAAKGNMTAALASLKDKLPEASLKKVALAHSLAVWSDDNLPVIKAVLAAQPDLTNLRDLALRFNVEKLTALVDPKAAPETTPGATADEKKRHFAVGLRQKLFSAEPTAVLRRMAEDAEIPIADGAVRSGITQFFNNQPDFNIRTTSIYNALKHPEAFKDIPDENRGAVVDNLKILQRVQALSPVPEAVPALMKADLTSAFHVAEKPESTFLRAVSPALGEDTARQVYTNAINAHIRNEQALTTMRSTVRGAGLAIIDGKRTREERIAALQKVADEKAAPLNLETLFGSLDHCECDDCLSVYSPASYFVELLQFLRNNDLDPNNPNTGQKSIAGTPLEKLFRRRPDLGCLELTCENTFTVLPYIDLVNEVMESFVVHLGNYHTDPNVPKQVTLETFNVEGETTNELLAIPQHVNYDAYCILKSAVYPFTLPYHQPIDATRIFLNYLKTSRWELLNTFRTAHEVFPNTTLSDAEQKELQALHTAIQDRAVDAEFLGLSQEECIILTKEAFWPKRYFEITQQSTYTDDEYRQHIGVRPVCEYYGYASDADMLSTDEDPKTGQKGLTFVKKQFLPRTGIQYTDLIDLLKTQFINPNFPLGKALTILESIRFSYRFLQTLVDTSNKDPKIRFANVIAFLENWQPLVPAINALLHPDPCKQQQVDVCVQSEDLRNWVYCYFERIGRLIVLESGQGPELIVSVHIPGKPTVISPLEGTLVDPSNGKTLGLVHANGVVSKIEGQKVAQVNVDLTVVDVNGKSLAGTLSVIATIDGADMGVAIIDQGRLSGLPPIWSPLYTTVAWTAARDTCDLDKVRLIHFDGTSLTEDEHDHIHRFIRLWRKLGWTIDEIDKALIGLAATPGTSKVPAVWEYVDFESFSRAGSEISADCECGPVQTGGCPDIPQVDYDITPAFLHQLVAVRKLLDQTGLQLPNLLAFWVDISTTGERSLYAKLFLRHNLLAIDSVFQADTNGNYLTQPAKITDHIPVLMAALKLKADDIATIVDHRLPDDSLTLHNVSALYRYSLLAKLLHLRVTDLIEVITLFGDPFTDADQTLDLLDTWRKMEDAGFTFRQLNYVIRDHDDPLRPLAPSQRKLLQLTKTLYDGLNAIDHDNRDVQQKEEATADLVRTKAGLLFEQSVVEQIVGLLEGTSVYTTNAPVGQTIIIKDTDPLSEKLKYIDTKDAVSASIQVTGILTDDEKMEAKALSNHSDWPKAIDRVGKQPLHVVFNDVLFGIFANKIAEAQNILLAGDYTNPTDPQDTQNTAPGKRFYFLHNFIPFLRERLYQRLIVDTMSGAAGLASDVTQFLLSEVLLAGTPKQSAMAVLEKIKDIPPANPTDFKGYLIPSIDDQYTFVAIADTPPTVSIDGQDLAFPHQQDDPSNVWSSDPVKLKAGKLYWLEVVKVQPHDQLQWKTATSPTATIPASALLPDYSSQGTKDAFVKLYKAGILVNGFSLTVDEISYFQTHPVNFDGFDFNVVTLQHWLRLQAYTELRSNLPKYDLTLLDLFSWASQTNDPKKLGVSAQVAAVTGWKTDNLDKLIIPEHFDLNRREDFRNETNLVKLRHATIVADKIGVDIDRLFEWAKPGSKFWVCHQTAEDIRKAIRARFDEDAWEQVVKPLNDQLREHQKQALIAYLLVQQDLIDWGVVDADSLFEFFLIDVQMDACMETSRIKQAISSVQLFVQRCLLGLEQKQINGTEVGVPNNAIDRDRWDWMQRYRVWEANRKVFLYPENWIISELRDDKSPFYKELESELLQKDINSQTVQDALKGYLIKVDEVANLKVVGLFLDDLGNRLHVFARTRNAPYSFYYRYFQVDEKNWYPWEKVQVDIPSYDFEVAGKIFDHGTYLSPVVWNNRLFIFFPQFVQKTFSSPASSGKTFQDIGTENIDAHRPIEFWEIKMGWSEYRNGKWTQKQQSAKGIYESPTPNGLPPIPFFDFVPRVVTNGEPAIVIDCYRTFLYFPAVALGSFHFQGSQIRESNSFDANIPMIQTDFHYAVGSTTIYSLQTRNRDPLPLFGKQPLFNTYEARASVTYDAIEAFNLGGGTVELDFYHPFVHDVLGRMATGKLQDLFRYYLAYFGSFIDQNKRSDVYGSYIGDDGVTVSFHELKRAYSLYNWEATFHAPMLLVDRLLKAQQFEQALQMCHYVLDPFAAGTDAKRFWQFPPFMLTNAENVLETLFLSLQPGKPNAEINEWRNKPFQPHVVARGRPSAYMKWVAMTYIKILIAWGDYLFRQDTIESINQATQLYVLAAHVYGPRGQKIPKRGKELPETYNSLLDKWDAFGNAMVELELAFPFGNQTPFPIGVSNGVVGLANVFGFATTLYFCIPDNPELTALRDTIDDRLFKIRHCENIAGVFRQLPLFEPPIDPALLVQAAAQGLSLSSVLNDLNSPMPNYRFYYLLQKALEVCNELKALGAAFLSAKEKGDGEVLSRLRATHESALQNLVMEVRKQQVDEAQKSFEALQQSRKGPVNRMQHYVQLIGEDLQRVPADNVDFEGLTDQIEQPIDESGLKLISDEKEEMDKASEAHDWQVRSSIVEALSAIFHALPDAIPSAMPLGVGTQAKIGGSHLGHASTAASTILQMFSSASSFQSTNAARKAGFLRQLQDRVLQANIAGFEIKNIDKQILIQNIRINIANQEITNQQKQIDNAKEVEDFLRSKYTSQELYAWMESQVRTLYYQAYTLAYDLAKKAEKVFRFERSLQDSNFIQFGYWDPAYDGLFAGERLYIGLKQLEAAYQEKRGYDFEIVKNISLQQLNPLALIQLRETGRCEFALPEVLFDMGYPGHYMRRIKSVAWTFACLVGPPTSMNCMLRLLEHKFRTSAIATGKNDYPEHTDETDDRFSTVNVPISSIAVSTGQNDSGVFELNFRDERYIPFEGAGAISKWRIELPDTFREFDYDSITDVVMHLRYTAIDGGDELRKIAMDWLGEYVKSVEDLSREVGLFAFFDLRHDFPNEWYSATQPPAGATERILTLGNVSERLPIFTRGTPPAKIMAANVYLFSSSPLSSANLALLQGTDEFSFADGQAAGTMKSFVANDVGQMSNWQLKIKDVNTNLDQLWLVVRYTLG